MNKSEVKKGTRVRVIKESLMDRVGTFGFIGDEGTVISEVLTSDYVKWDKDGSVSGPNPDRLEVIGGNHILYHCFRIDGSKAGFEKLGDFNLPVGEIDKYLFSKFGNGFYMYKAKNEKRGKIVTIRRPDPAAYEVTEGLLEL